MDVIAELKFIERRQLDPILANIDIAHIVFSALSPLVKYQELLNVVQWDARLTLAKHVQFHLQQMIRRGMGLPPLTWSEKQHWLARPPRSDLSPTLQRLSPLKPPPPSKTAKLKLSKTMLHKIANVVAANFPEEAAYARAAGREQEIHRDGWRIGYLRAPHHRIDVVMKHLLPGMKI